MNKIITAASLLTLCLCSCEPISKLTSSHGEYLSGVGGTTAGVSTAIPVEARLGQGYWDVPAGLTGPKKIVIDNKLQKVTYYIGSTLVGMSPMSSGKEGHGTPAGTYKIIQKAADYKSGTYGVLRSKATNEVVNGDFSTKKDRVLPGTYYDPAPMPYFMRFHGGYGMHVGFVAGYPVSHGCVRLPADMAKIFFDNTPLGTTCVVK